MGSCAAPSAKGDDKFITTDYLQQCHNTHLVQYLSWVQIKKFRQGVVRKVGSSLSLRVETERQPDMD
ncbi:hypothetical protein, partial [Klebsiella oxytoca]|uniref:hypothetical protein n=1 Tax=Klebsiella oxytoca TaxID=571 RepID=UPI00259AB6EA